MVKAYYSYEYSNSIGAGSSHLLPVYKEINFEGKKATFYAAEEDLNIVLISTG
jgi:hypothetical protein